MHRAYQEGDYATAVEAAERISHLMAVYDVCDLFISSIKVAVMVKGLPVSTKVFEPAVQATPEQVERIRELGLRRQSGSGAGRYCVERDTGLD